jgi:hypothetical protein
MSRETAKPLTPRPYVNRFRAWMWFAGMSAIMGIMLGMLQILAGDFAGVAVTAVTTVAACFAVRWLFQRFDRRCASAAAVTDQS